MLKLKIKKANTLLSLLLKGDINLKRKGISQSRLNAESLLAHILMVPRERLYSRFEQTLSQEIIKDFWDLIIKRGRNIPLQYLTQKIEFWSIPLKIDKRAFIPRPETELLIEEVLRLKTPAAATIVDVGTGCGNIALALAREMPKAQVFAVDISPQALELARENAQSLNLAHRITFLQGDLLSPLEENNLCGETDFIVSNPPYIEPQELEELQPEVRLYEPRVALLAPEPGLGIYQRLITQAEDYLQPGGYLIIEIGISQLPKLRGIFRNFKNWSIETIRKDLNGIPRVLCACFEGT